MVKRFVLSVLFGLGVMGAAVAPASAAVEIRNGDFTGARSAYGSNPLVPTPMFFGAHTDLLDYGWSNTGSGALSYVLSTGTQGVTHAPSNPAGYSGNIYAADASPLYNAGTYLVQTLTGLTIGQTYAISFLQAGASMELVSGETAQWDVGFGGAIVRDLTGLASLTSDAVVKSSALMTIDSSTGQSAWQSQSLTFKATSTSQLLSFFASGSGAPPFALLADVSITAVPETTTWLMMIAGLGMIGLAVRRARAQRGDTAAGALTT